MELNINRLIECAEELVYNGRMALAERGEIVVQTLEIEGNNGPRTCYLKLVITDEKSHKPAKRYKIFQDQVGIKYVTWLATSSDFRLAESPCIGTGDTIEESAKNFISKLDFLSQTIGRQDIVI